MKTNGALCVWEKSLVRAIQCIDMVKRSAGSRGLRMGGNTRRAGGARRARVPEAGAHAVYLVFASRTDPRWVGAARRGATDRCWSGHGPCHAAWKRLLQQPSQTGGSRPGGAAAGVATRRKKKTRARSIVLSFAQIKQLKITITSCRSTARRPSRAPAAPAGGTGTPLWRRGCGRSRRRGAGSAARRWRSAPRRGARRSPAAGRPCVCVLVCGVAWCGLEWNGQGASVKKGRGRWSARCGAHTKALLLPCLHPPARPPALSPCPGSNEEKKKPTPGSSGITKRPCVTAVSAAPSILAALRASSAARQGSPERA